MPARGRSGREHRCRGGGHRFVLDTWVRNIVEHTPQNMERYFSPQAIGDEDERFQELQHNLTARVQLGFRPGKRFGLGRRTDEAERAV